MGRSNKEQRDIDMGSGLLSGAKKALQGRTRSIDDAVDEMSGAETPKKKKRNQASDEESE